LEVISKPASTRTTIEEPELATHTSNIHVQS